MMNNHYKPHRLAKYFPLLEGEEFDQLVKDIDDNGQLEPIVLFEGQILDGVNRYRACQVLDREPIAKEYEGDDPIKYVISANIRRRHLTEGQLGIISLEMEEELKKRFKQSQSEKISHFRQTGETLSVESEPKSWAEAAAREFGISESTVRRAQRIRDEAPEKLEEVKKGNKSLSQVDQELREARARDRAETKTERKEERKRQEIADEVKIYLDAMKEYRQHLETAIRVARYGKFSPEGYQFTIRKHNEIRQLLDEFEGVNDG
jgi:predicted CopG family antitoxin